MSGWRSAGSLSLASGTPAFNPSTPLFVRLSLPEQVVVEQDGAVTYIQRLTGTFSFADHLGDFPFDDHNIELEFFFQGHEVGDIEVVEGTLVRRSTKLSIADRNAGDGEFSIEPISLAPKIPTFDGFVYRLHVERETSYYVWKVILPMLVIVFMSWVVFWIHPSHVGPQIGLSATSILTIIAYRFAMSDAVPKVSHMTRLDAFMNGAFILVFLALVEVVLAMHLNSREGSGLGVKTDQVARVVFPISLLGIVACAFWS